MSQVVRIANVDIPVDKRAEIALCSIYGIGRNRALKILSLARLENKRVKEFSDDEITRLRTVIDSRDFLIEGDLRQKIYQDIKRLRDIRSYRGIRHKLGLPVRGQVTRHNAHTRKGRHIAVGGLKRKLEKT